MIYELNGGKIIPQLITQGTPAGTRLCFGASVLWKPVIFWGEKEGTPCTTQAQTLCGKGGGVKNRIRHECTNRGEPSHEKHRAWTR